MNYREQALRMMQSMGGNPTIANAYQMALNGNENGLKTIAYNLAREKGADMNELLKQMNTNGHSRK